MILLILSNFTTDRQTDDEQIGPLCMFAKRQSEKTDREVIRHINLSNLPGEEAKGLGQGDIIALLKQGKSFYTLR